MLAARPLLLACTLSLLALLHASPSVAESAAQPYITEGYYRVKWGYFDEFMALFKKNHFPILKKMQELGHIQSMEAAFPLHHASEDSRWDFRLTIVIADTAAFAKALPEVTKALYPDEKKLKEEEHYRFTLLLAHQDLVIRHADTTNW